MNSSEVQHQFHGYRQAAWMLGIAGLIPFVTCALVVLIVGSANAIAKPTAEIFVTYSAVILSFLGGIRWGRALIDENQSEQFGDTKSLVLSVIPSLLAWAALLMPVAWALPLLLLAICAQGAWDSFSAQSGLLPQWFSPLRMLLTVVVATCNIVIFLILA